jgi:hypothetical protein
MERKVWPATKRTRNPQHRCGIICPYVLPWKGTLWGRCPGKDREGIDSVPDKHQRLIRGWNSLFRYNSIPATVMSETLMTLNAGVT